MTPLVLLTLALVPTAGPGTKPARKPDLVIPASARHDVRNASAVAISRDGTLVAAAFWGYPTADGAPPQVAVYDRKSGHQIYLARAELTPVSLEFSRDGRYLAWSAVGTVFTGDYTQLQTKLVDLKEKKELKTWGTPRREDEPHPWGVPAFAMSPTEDHILLGTAEHVEVLSLPDLKVVQRVRVTQPRRIAVSPDGKWFAALYADGKEKDRLMIASLKERVSHWTYKGHGLERAHALAFSPDGRRVATGHQKGGGRVWSAVWEGAAVRELKINTPFDAFPLWIDEDVLALVSQPVPPKQTLEEDVARGDWADMYWHDLSASPPAVTHWRLENALLRSPNGHSGVVVGTEYNSGRYALSADGRRLVAACNGFCTINLITRKVERTFPGASPLDTKK